MWEEFKKERGYYPTYSVNKKLVSEMMEIIEQKYFPKPSKWHKINDMIDGLNTIGHSTDIKELINLLIELRDEELEGSD